MNALAERAEAAGFEEVLLPLLEPAEVYRDKAGDEVLNQMYTFPDKKGRLLCLRPEGTATCQLMADSVWKMTKSKFVAAVRIGKDVVLHSVSIG